MRLITFSFLLALGSCAWSQAEFRKWAQSANETPEQLGNVGARAEEVEKFKVEDLPSEKPAEKKASSTAKPNKKSKTNVKNQKNKVKAKTDIHAVALKPAEFAYPKDMPEEVKKLDIRSEKTWKNFTPTFTSNEIQFLDVDYLGMTVGKVSMAYKGIKMMSGEEVYHFQARFKTAPFYSSLYELDDTIDTYVEKKNFFGKRYNLTQRESKQSVDEVQLYDQDKMRTTAYQKQVRPNKTKNRNWEGWMPHYNIDSFSAIYLIRGLPLKPGDSYAVTIVNKAKLLVLELKVELKEKIRISGKEKNTIRVHAFTKYSGATLKSGDMTFWLADTPGKELLRAKADIKIGSVYLEVTKKD